MKIMKFYQLYFQALYLITYSFLVSGNADFDTVSSRDLRELIGSEEMAEEMDFMSSDAASKRISMGHQFDASECSLEPEVKKEIRGYYDVVQRIVKESTHGTFQNKAYIDLAYLVDTFGPRISGSDALEHAISYLHEEMTKKGLINVHEENVTVPKWIPGTETAEMLKPRKKSISVKSLGLSVPTPKEGMMGEVFVIKSFRELRDIDKSKVKGKILLFNANNGEAMLHSLIGASYAAEKGAIAALARSGTPFSLYSPHTGIQIYVDERYPKIPIAALTVEDAELITRLFDRGERVWLKMQLDVIEDTTRVSKNLIGDYIGSSIPEKYVMLAGHTDSWHVGQGALDDGIGPILALTATNLLSHLNLRPMRSIRNVYFTSEETMLVGSRQYFKNHLDELKNYTAVMEADFGCLRAGGLLFTGNSKMGCVLQEILQLFKGSPAAESSIDLLQTDRVYTDIYHWTKEGIPGMVLLGDDGRYFWYHHTEADTMTALVPKVLDQCVAQWASVAYVIADLTADLRDNY